MLGNPLANTARTADRLIRPAIKKVLNLPMSTLCGDFVYISRRQGGLGFASLSQKTELGLLRLIAKMSTCEDSASRALAEIWTTQVYEASFRLGRWRSKSRKSKS
ncbi:hypothetical protein M514_06480 [Trichuris suis]|uniref:Uncharacterized protein n=1 Tax=Trichuris suis TaxID=68888 RepID=A0A085M5Y7_9BILA|nr:hypothetical protein M513_06480 [Trichuris suis]KFD63865.1 hypothetical protein M514_06480 [Trichuris suis]